MVTIKIRMSTNTYFSSLQGIIMSNSDLCSITRKIENKDNNYFQLQSTDFFYVCVNIINYT